MERSTEWADILDFLFDLKDELQKAKVPEPWVEPLFDKAHKYIWERRPPEDIYEVINRIFDIWDGFS